MKMVVGIVGAKGSGKDTIADFLVSRYGFTKRAYADPIKEVCRHAFLLDEKQLNGDLKDVEDARWGVTPRHAMQSFGTDYVRQNFGEDHWIKHMRLWMDARHEQANFFGRDDANDLLVIPDVRFHNEAAFVREHPRSLLIRVVRASAKADDLHVSEQQQKDIDVDVALCNDGSYDELFFHVSRVVSAYLDDA